MQKKHYQDYNQEFKFKPPQSQPPRNRIKIPYVLPYAILLIFNGLLYAVNYIYADLKNGDWSPAAFAAQPQNLKQRPYEIIVYVLNSVATLIFFAYMMYPGHESSIRSQKAMVVRWFLHLIAFSLIILIWILDSSQLWVYKISLIDIAFNSNWSDPLYTTLYAITVAYGFLLAFPSSVYLLYRYFIRAQDNYKITREGVQYHQKYNKFCYFVTYLSIIIVIAINLAYLNDYQTYFADSVYPNYRVFANLQSEMLLPVLYVDYILSGLSMLFAAFLLIKETFTTMKDKRKHIKRQLIILTAVMFFVDLLTLGRFVQVNRYQKVIKAVNILPSQSFLDLYYHLRVVMWCYIFLLFPLNIYSIRNLWVEWKNQFSAGNLSELRGSQIVISQQPVRSNHSQQPSQAPLLRQPYQQENRYPTQERRPIIPGRSNQYVVQQRPPSPNKKQSTYTNQFYVAPSVTVDRGHPSQVFYPPHALEGRGRPREVYKPQDTEEKAPLKQGYVIPIPIIGKQVQVKVGPTQSKLEVDLNA